MVVDQAFQIQERIHLQYTVEVEELVGIHTLYHWAGLLAFDWVVVPVLKE